MYVIHESLKKKPKCRVELHIHLDGAIRHETIWELLRRKKLPLPGNGSLKDLKESLHVGEPKDLYHFLKPFQIFMPALIDDLEAIERIAYEFVEDQARESVLYCEARLCPQLLLSRYLKDISREDDKVIESENETSSFSDSSSELTLESVMEACLRGLRKGEEQFETKVNLILCCIRKRSEWCPDILRLCLKYRDMGVVGIDLAGNDAADTEFDNVAEVEIFTMAKENGIHITVHAGEDGGPHEIKKALSLLHAERIGHGYHVLEDEDLYKKCLQDRVHFEMCPHSSYLTGSIKKLDLASKRHPILRLAEDGASFSINTDDPTCTDTWISDEYKLLQSWGFTEAHFVKANFEAATRCFLPPEEKDKLLNKLMEAYGVPSLPSRTSYSTMDPSSVNKLQGDKATSSQAVVERPEFKIAPWGDRLNNLK